MHLLSTFTFAAAALTLGADIPWSSETPPNSVTDPNAAAFVAFEAASEAAPFLVTGNAEGIRSFYLDGGSAPWSSAEAIAALDSRPGNPAILVGINPATKQLISWNFSPDGGVAPGVAPATMPNTQSVMPIALQYREGTLYAMSAVLWKNSKGADQRSMLLYYEEKNAWVSFESRTFSIPLAGVSDDRTGYFYGAIEGGSVIAGKSVTGFPSTIIYADSTKPLPDAIALYPVGAKDTLLLVHRGDGTLEIYQTSEKNRTRAELLGTATFKSSDGTRALTSGNRMAFLTRPSKVAGENPAGMLALYDAAEKNFKFVPWNAIASAFHPKLPGADSAFPEVANAGSSEDAGSAGDAGTKSDAASPEDASSAKDMFPAADAGSSLDAGSGLDAGSADEESVPPQACGCTHGSSGSYIVLLVGSAVLLLRRALQAR